MINLLLKKFIFFKSFIGSRLILFEAFFLSYKFWDLILGKCKFFSMLVNLYKEINDETFIIDDSEFNNDYTYSNGNHYFENI